MPTSIAASAAASAATAAVAAATAAAKVEIMATKLEAKVDAIAVDVKSLLATRSFTQGALRMASVIAAVVGSIVSGGLLWLTRHN